MSATIESTASGARHDSLEAGRAAMACENCAAALAGPFCSQCGQRHHEHPVESFWHFLQEATEDMTHADSRLWRTLRALLIRPGALTREFLDGHRVRYLPPVRLYLVVSVMFFFITGLATSLGSAANVIVVHRGKDFRMAVVPSGAAAGAPVAINPRPACAQVGR
jgi:hypothetical protein